MINTPTRKNDLSEPTLIENKFKACLEEDTVDTFKLGYKLMSQRLDLVILKVLLLSIQSISLMPTRNKIGGYPQNLPRIS